MNISTQIDIKTEQKDLNSTASHGFSEGASLLLCLRGRSRLEDGRHRGVEDAEATDL